MLRTVRLRRLLAIVILAQCAGIGPARGQARDTVASLRTRYNTVKTQAKAEGELKRRLDALDEAILRAARLGRTGALRHLYTEGITLASGRAWTAELDFAGSLALRTDRVFVDPSGPFGVRLEQIYVPSLDLAEPPSMRVSLHKPGSTATQPGEKLKDAGTFDNVSRDLIDNPFRFDVDLSGIPDGRIIVRAEVLDGSRSLGAATLAIEARKGLDARLRRLESESNQAKSFDFLRGEVLYPLDYVRNVDRGRVAIGQFNVDRELTMAESVLASIKAGQDPFMGRTGDFKRHYLLDEAAEIMPYRVFVPAAYKGDRAFPLIIALHGNGGTENTFFDGFESQVPRLAEERGYIVAAPLGYRVDGGYGYNNGSRPAEDMRKLQLSEKDVLQVLNLMKRQYRIDENRMYLAGHSMGGFGSWYLGARYSQIWAALAPFAGGGDSATMSQMKDVPQFVVHGDADATVSVERSRTMVAEMKRLGVEHVYIEVPGGTHGNIVAPNVRAMFDFFDRHRKAQSN